MTETPPQGPDLQTSQARGPSQGSSGSRWISIALAVSVALNLAVAGLAAGAWMREGLRHGAPRDMSFGPFTEALNDADRRELRRALGDRAPEFREARQQMQADREALLAALRAEPFDPAAVDAALDAFVRRAGDRLEFGRDLIAGRIRAMTDAERQAFAERLERGQKWH